MTLLCATRQEEGITHSSKNNVIEYTLEEIKNIPLYHKYISRVENLVNKGIKLTDDVLTKLKIPLPPSRGVLSGVAIPN